MLLAEFQTRSCLRLEYICIWYYLLPDLFLFGIQCVRLYLWLLLHTGHGALPALEFVQLVWSFSSAWLHIHISAESFVLALFTHVTEVTLNLFINLPFPKYIFDICRLLLFSCSLPSSVSPSLTDQSYIKKHWTKQRMQKVLSCQPSVIIKKINLTVLIHQIFIHDTCLPFFPSSILVSPVAWNPVKNLSEIWINYVNQLCSHN